MSYSVLSPNIVSPNSITAYTANGICPNGNCDCGCVNPFCGIDIGDWFCDMGGPYSWQCLPPRDVGCGGGGGPGSQCNINEPFR